MLAAMARLDWEIEIQQQLEIETYPLTNAPRSFLAKPWFRILQGKVEEEDDFL